MIIEIINRFYNEKVEDFSTRVLYFFNTIDTYFFIAGLSSFFLYKKGFDFNIFFLLMISASIILIFKLADFYPLFLLFTPAYLYFLFKSQSISFSGAGLLLLINMGIFVLIQFLFMGIPDSIVARDPTIGIRKIWNSIFTIAPTTVSISMSVCFSTLYSLILVVSPTLLSLNGLLFWLTICTAALVTFYFKPKTFVSASFKPEIIEKIAEKVVVLNIDGCRLDRFYEAGLPFLTSLQKESSYFPLGLQTVYRALTNPAFASILTGTVPHVHRVKNNNLGQSIKVEALPDIVKTKLYGSMHVKHFSKEHWNTRIVSLPTLGIYKSDDIVFDWLKEDLLTDDGTRLFVVDLSETDFLGHAYGSESDEYLEAIKRADERIEKFFERIKKYNLFESTVIIICSDHGIVRIDHSYLLFKAERLVPFMITGKRIKANNPLRFKASIMDITPTISYLLGVKYPDSCKGRVFIEALE